jgi:LDH2 family malate/lactate/ureidoglycolate dehydrogenase
MIGMRKLSGCQCRNILQLIGGKELLASTWPMRILTPRRPGRPRWWVLDNASRA